MPTVPLPPMGGRTMEAMTEPMGVDVLTAARQRINDILDRYDSVAVAFSGGKDSLVVLHLLREEMQKRDPDAVVPVIFRDEEVINNTVIDFVDSYRQRPWVKMLWFAVPLRSSKFVLGVVKDYIQWDVNRKLWVRDKPEWAITDDDNVYDQYSMDSKIAEYFPGKICVLTGIRCQESITRYRAVLNKRGNPEVCATAEKRVHLGRPIYDWSQDDVFKYFYDRQIPYCEIYDWQSAGGEWQGDHYAMNLRVSTPLHAECAKRMDKLREVDPEFFERVLECFPDAAIQAKYYADYRPDLPKTVEELEGWIESTFEGDQLELARTRLGEVKGFWRDQVKGAGYPLDYVIKKFAAGVIKRVFLPAVGK